MTSLKKIVGKGYKDFWHCKKRYRVVKGSRSSKKSTTTALNIIYRMMEYGSKGLYPNTLVVRKTYRTLQESCYFQLKWAIHKLEVDHLWDCKASPLSMTYIPTGQKILFRGLDDPLKLTSTTVEIGILCWAWIEEAYEISSETDFDMLDESIRGNSEGLFKQITLTFNPWNERHWLKKRFFDNPNEDIFAITTNYLCNEFLDSNDLRLFESMEKRNPRRYQVAGLGNWGIVEGLIFENWQEREFTLSDVKHCKTFCGMDFGYTNDPTAFVIGFIDTNKQEIWIWDELYKKALVNKDIAKKIESMGYRKEVITCDSAEPKSIEELKQLGLKVKGARKGKDSINNGIQFIQDYKIYIKPRCNNFITEISNYSWKKDKFGKSINEPEDEFNHLMDALRYGIEKYIINKGLSYSQNRII